MTTEWTDRFKQEVPKEERGAFLTELQALVAALREGRPPVLTPRLRRHADLTLAYLDEGSKKDRARDALGGRKP